MTRFRGTRLLLMRCGATDWDQAGRVQGSTDLPLSAEGRAGVIERAQALQTEKLSVILSAPDDASRETAQIMASAVRTRIEVVPEFRELGLGLWEGLRRAELEQRCRAGRMWLEDGPCVIAPEGTSSLGEYADDLRPVLGKLLEKRRGGAWAVGLVVRPIALGVTRCWLNSADLSAFWAMTEAHLGDEWYDLQPADVAAGQAPALKTPFTLPGPASGSGRTTDSGRTSDSGYRSPDQPIRVPALSKQPGSYQPGSFGGKLAGNA